MEPGPAACTRAPKDGVYEVLRTIAYWSRLPHAVDTGQSCPDVVSCKSERGDVDAERLHYNAWLFIRATHPNLATYEI